MAYWKVIYFALSVHCQDKFWKWRCSLHTVKLQRININWTFLCCDFLSYAIEYLSQNAQTLALFRHASATRCQTHFVCFLLSLQIRNECSNCLNTTSRFTGRFSEMNSRWGGGRPFFLEWVLRSIAHPATAFDVMIMFVYTSIQLSTAVAIRLQTAELLKYCTLQVSMPLAKIC